MSHQPLAGKRIFITHADVFMGPTLCKVLTEQGATVIADTHSLLDKDEPAALIEAAGDIDILIASLAIPAPTSLAIEASDQEWAHTFAHLVDPLPRLCRAVLPQMIERQAGKILVVGSASALRGIKRASTYSAARGAQLAYAQSLALEVAKEGVQVNAIAQNFVDNPTYFPQEVQQMPAFQERLKREVPLGRLVTMEEDSTFIAYLCSDAANCFVGQVFPVCGGWVNR
ncbi:SDR family oxidoreductase [Oceanicoccus sagamiensis]|uniref:Short-chain dehydrogenase n=1 Tax=Oceanicoccus sagamiensis TaxID=716816 RepID=A0A1X9NCY7_9GAMM|nr:SDR family oxidoreductase [Oceanicoccus sagamiensis]ARN75021.1 short-chain dehydrogenase [Oceanicoccus sagamiensis]